MTSPMWLLAAGLLVLTASEQQTCTSETCRQAAQEAQEDEDVSAMQLQPRKKPPHVILILADDYGWANIGLHRKVATTPAEKQGQAEVNTPNLDGLAKDGILLERHYAYKICSPSRSSLQSGRLAVHVNTKNTGVTFWQPSDNVTGFAGIPRNMTGLAQLMKNGGYKTHMVGKWDAGMATPQHTPYGKGYDSWMGYFQHANDYWTEGLPFQSTGDIDNCENRFVDHSLYNDTYRGGVTTEIRRELGCRRENPHKQEPNIQPTLNATGCGEKGRGCDETFCLPDSCYEEAMFNSYALKIIREHKKRDPLFLFYAFHLVHGPLQIPQSYLDKLANLVETNGGRKVETQNRLYYAAMTLYLDDMVGKVIDLLKQRDMYKDTLIVFTADNGGPVYEPGGANNYPLKGGKYSDWEGGVRTNAFVSGGYVPPRRRGTKFEGIISIADWYATLATIAGVNYTDTAAADANPHQLNEQLLPLAPVDGIPQWDNIVNDVNGRPDPLHLSSQAVLHFPWKLITGKQEYTFHQGPLYPNCTTVKNAHNGPLGADLGIFGQEIKLSANVTEQDLLTYTYDCGGGCLYNVQRDPTESTDLAGLPQYADLLFQLQTTLYNLNLNNFEPYRGTPALEACKTGAGIGGFYGPFVDAEDFYEGVKLTPKEKIIEKAVVGKLWLLNKTLDKIPDLVVDAFVDNFGLVTFLEAMNFNTTLDVCYADTPIFGRQTHKGWAVKPRH